jgi:hypothetical protein
LKQRYLLKKIILELNKDKEALFLRRNNSSHKKDVSMLHMSRWGKVNLARINYEKQKLSENATTIAVSK